MRTDLRGRGLRPLLLAAVAAAILLVPAAQAAAAPGVLHVNITGAGSGEVNSVEGTKIFGSSNADQTGEPPIECTGPPPTGTCETQMEVGEFGEEVIALAAIPDPGSRFVEWDITEGEDVSFFCGEPFEEAKFGCVVGWSFAEETDASITAVFEPIPSVLSVFKGGNGSGTVTSDPVGINCGTEPCSAEFETGETVTLTAAAASGSAFAGWIGCHPVAGETNKCTVTLDDLEADVTAVFMAEGAQGPQGDPGTTGSQGSAGQDGADGQNGANGSQGPAGAAGAAGPPGPQGERGPEGKVKVTCKVKGKKVKCQVKTAGASSKRPNLRWRLMRDGHAVSHGATSPQRLERVLNNLRPGHYVLHVNGQTGGTHVVVR